MLSEIYRVLTPTGTYICVSHGTEKQRKKYLKNVKKFNWTITKVMVQKPVVGQNYKELKIPKEDDKKNFHFMYICKKQVEPVLDSSDEEMMAEHNRKLEAEKAEQEKAAQLAAAQAEQQAQ